MSQKSRLGLIAFANDGGLGAQTRRLAQMLHPEKVLAIDSSGFSKNKAHHFEWYPADRTMITQGFPKNHEVLAFIEGLTHVFTCENPYNFYLVKACQERGIKVICQTNYEFCENVSAPHLPVPDIFAMPSHWMIEEMRGMFGLRVMYLPPPIDPAEFLPARNVNLGRSGKTRFLHIVGVNAWKDRNGALDLLDAVRMSKGEYELVIRSQHPLSKEYVIDDPRITLLVGNVEKNVDLYKDFDALILPRRYGGLSLTTNEALMSGLPVMMPDISPNNRLLPNDWLVPARSLGSFTARAEIPYYAVDVPKLAEKIDVWAKLPPLKIQAINLGQSNFSMDVLKPQYDAILGR